jgi:hypothetical protein
MPPVRRTRNRTTGEEEELPDILVVTEDSVTEPTYIDNLRRHHRLPTVQVEASSRSEPSSVVEYGLSEFLPDPANAGGEPEFDRLYCVFDRDEHAGFDDAVERLRRIANNGRSVHWIYSIPCFEYWILLHFENSGSLEYYEGSGSPCQAVVDDIESCSDSPIDDYESIKPDLFSETYQFVETAIRHSTMRWSQHGGRNFDDYHPRTRMHELIEHFQQIR